MRTISSRSGRGWRVRGLSFLEVALAIVILGLALLPVLGLFSSAGRQARQSSDYGVALSTLEKITEELRLANWENPHLARSLAEDLSLGDVKPIVDGQSPFFAVLEDVAAPLGRLVPGSDPPVTLAFAPSLHRLLSTYRVKLSARAPAPGPQDPVLDLDLAVDWTDPEGRDRTLPTVLRIARYSPTEELPRLMEDRVAADALIVQTLYPTEGGRLLFDVVATRGGDLPTIRALGDVTVVIEALLQGAKEASAAATQILVKRDAQTDSGAKARVQIELARTYEAAAAVHLQALAYLLPIMTKLADTFTPGQLGSPPADLDRYEETTLVLQSVVYACRSLLSQTRQAYAVGYEAPLGTALSPRLRVRTFMKLLDVLKLEVLTADAPDLAPLRMLVTDFRASQEGRNPNFFAFSEYELATATKDLPSLEDTYPNPARYLVWREQAWLAPDVTDRVAFGGSGNKNRSQKGKGPPGPPPAFTGSTPGETP